MIEKKRWEEHLIRASKNRSWKPGNEPNSRFGKPTGNEELIAIAVDAISCRRSDFFKLRHLHLPFSSSLVNSVLKTLVDRELIVFYNRSLHKCLDFFFPLVLWDIFSFFHLFPLVFFHKN